MLGRCIWPNPKARQAMSNSKSLEIMRRPYERVLIPEAEGGYSAYISEFEGCFAEGESADEALSNLESTALAWIEAEQDAGRTIPDARNQMEYSGKVLLRLPKTLHGQLVRQASNEGVSLNQYLVHKLSTGADEGQITQVVKGTVNKYLRQSVQAMGGSFTVKSGTKTGTRGRDSETGAFVPTSSARGSSKTSVVERVPKPGYGKSRPK